MRSIKRASAIVSLIGLLILCLSQCTGTNESSNADLRGTEYAEPSSCISCHRSITDNYQETSHFHTSSAFDVSNVDTTDVQKKVFRFSDHLKVQIEKRGNKIYQVSFSDETELEARPFDVVFGSGEKAQTYGYWSKNGLFQLPLSYYTTIESWANSPGFPADRPNFQRAIVSRCLECHSSFADHKLVKTGPLSVNKEVVEGSVLYGIDCQRCHGPAAEHVQFHRDNPDEKVARFMTTFKELSRQQKIDQCAVCHSGNDQLTQRSTFEFQPGDTLANFYYPQYTSGTKEDDVHGKQLQMMAASACFIKSDMNCSTCHNPHKSGKELTEVLIQKCKNCHQTVEHPQLSGAGSALLSNCIDCHMPLQESRQISFQVNGSTQKEPYLLRNHKIGIYEAESKRVLRYLETL